MPELPEVQALVDFLRTRTDGLVVTGVELGSISVLKTFTPPPQALVGAPVDLHERRRPGHHEPRPGRRDVAAHRHLEAPDPVAAPMGADQPGPRRRRGRPVARLEQHRVAAFDAPVAPRAAAPARRTPRPRASAGA